MILTPTTLPEWDWLHKEDEFLDNEKAKIRNDFINRHTQKQAGWLEEIKKIRPFEKQEPFIDYTAIQHITALGYGESGTGEVFRIETDNGKKYKLRKCRTNDSEEGEKRADHISACIKDSKDILPHFYWQQNEYLLFDRLDDLQDFWDYTSPDKREKLWELLAKVHTTETKDIDKTRAKQWCERKLDKNVLQNEFSIEEREKIQTIINRWLENPNTVFWLDIWDLKVGDIKVDQQWKLYLIDEDGIEHTIQWIGIGKLLKRKPEWLNITEMKKWYEKIVKNSHIFDQEFLDFAKLFMSLNNLRRKKRAHENYSSVKTEILDSIKSTT